MDNVTHISRSTSQYCGIFKQLGQGSTGFGRKSKRRVSSVTNPLQQSTCLKEWDVGPEVHPTMQAAVHSSTELQALHPSTTAFLTPLQLLLGMQTAPLTHKLHLQATFLCSAISVLDDEGKENPAFCQAFFPLHNQSTQP